MVTFDQNGIATPASQAFVQEKVNLIVNDPKLNPYEKEAKLRDLYNQYDLKYGTFERKSEFHVSYRRDPSTRHLESKSPISGAGIVLILFVLTMLWFLGDLNKILIREFDFNLIKTIEHFFQWLFS